MRKSSLIGCYTNEERSCSDDEAKKILNPYIMKDTCKKTKTNEVGID